MSVDKIKYWGKNRNGVTIGGQAAVNSVTEFVEGKFDNGWRSLTVHAIDDGRQVGGIVKDGKPRRWWAER